MAVCAVLTVSHARLYVRGAWRCVVAQAPTGRVARWVHRVLLPGALGVARGPVAPPGKGPATTLVVTDVEKSTEL